MKHHGSLAGLSLFSTLFAMGCTAGLPGTGEADFELDSDKVEFRRTASPGVLSQAERQTYLDDRRYMTSLARPGAGFGVNHADPRQHRFVLTRLKIAGKTPESSPQLFQAITALKARQEARGLTRGAVETQAENGDLASQHQMLAMGPTTRQGTVASGAMASRKDSLTRILVDSATYDGFGNFLGDLSIVEVFGDMRYDKLHSTGDLTFAVGDQIMGDSLLTEIVAGTGVLQQSFAFTPARRVAALAELATTAVIQPRDGNNDGVIKLCLERNAADCDKHNMGTVTLKLPLEGTITLNGTDVEIDEEEIKTKYQTVVGPNPGRVFVTLGTNGGGCQLPAQGQNLAMLTFWKNVTVTNNGTTLRWDMHTNPLNWATFSNQCRLVQDTVFFTMELEVPYIDNAIGVKDTLAVMITNAPQPRPLPAPNVQIPQPIRITNSCLAAGTLITAPGAAPRKIEDIKVGDRVISPFSSTMTVMDTSIGTEKAPMVRITDTRGRELLMTELHPLYVIGRGMVPAKHLKIGDRVRTEDGGSMLVRVAREAYDGQVHNLKVGNSEEVRALAAEQTAVYANGFLVGDSQVQSAHEIADVKASVPASANRLPASMRRDYETALRAR